MDDRNEQMTTSPPQKPKKYKKAHEHIGSTFFRLTVLEITGRDPKKRAIAKCRCQCGSEHSAVLDGIVRGITKSCGCWMREQLSKPTHERIAAGPSKPIKDIAAKRKSQTKWRKANPEKAAATARRFRERHSTQIKTEKAAYYQKNKRRIIDKLIERFATDAGFRVEQLVRGRIRSAIKQRKAEKSARTLELLGCSVDEFRVHIESLFVGEMSWEKFMAGEIHLDHSTPLALFDLTDPAQQLIAFNYKNHAPMWAADNLRKSDLLPDGTRARFLRKAAALAQAADTLVPELPAELLADLSPTQ